MNIHWAQFLTFLFSLFAVTNPFGNLAIFIGLTADKTVGQIHKLAIEIAIAVAIILVISVWIGSYILQLFAISISSFQIAGGIIILLIGLSMLQARLSRTSHSAQERHVAKATDSIAIVPMSIPIVAGPGAMTTVIVNAHTYQSTLDHFDLSIGCLIIAAVIAIVFFLAGPISKMLGENGVKVLSRIMGMVLTAIAIQMLITGMRTAFPSLA